MLEEILEQEEFNHALIIVSSFTLQGRVSTHDFPLTGVVLLSEPNPVHSTMFPPALFPVGWIRNFLKLSKEFKTFWCIRSKIELLLVLHLTEGITQISRTMENVCVCIYIFLEIDKQLHFN